MRTLYLLRHAKSSWKDEALIDFERPLAGRGRKACITIARYLESNAIEFDLTLCSTAVRARETIDLVRQTAKIRSEIRYDERIYEASAERLLAITSEIENEYKSVLIVGHNPGLAELLRLLTGHRDRFVTACLAKIKLKISKWSEATENNRAAKEWVVCPKDFE